MNLHPTRSTFHVALAGAALVALGSAARAPLVVAFGGAMVLAVAAGRAIALVAVTRLRAAGFEMVWAQTHRVVRVARGETVTLAAELRNRGVDDMRGVALRAVTSSMLEATITPSSMDLPAGSRVRVDIVVRAKRVGRWGVHGVALEVRGAPAGGEGLYEVPLMFANPFGIEVFPKALQMVLQSPRGGRSRRSSEVGRPAASLGEGEELRELREHVPGDPFKRIAWKASARRGQLLVREMERDERDIVWLLLDASVELWAGADGRAPLDSGVDAMATLAARHLARGDSVGLVVYASRVRSFIPPGKGGGHAMKLAAALASAASVIDADRSESDENDVAQRVSEHARPLDSRGLADVPRGNLDMLAARAEALRSRAPFAPRLPQARSPREQRLRLYLAAFGVELPPRMDGERDKTELTLAGALEKITASKPRPSVVHVWAPAPGTAGSLPRVLQRLKRLRAEVRWSLPPFEQSVGSTAAQVRANEDTSFPSTVEEAVDDAVRLRAHASQRRGERLLKKMGVQLQVSPWYPPQRAGLTRAAS